MPRGRQAGTSTAGSSWSGDGLAIYFSSKRCQVEGRLTERLVEFIGGAKRTLDVAIYDLRAPEVLTALRAALEAGIGLRIAYDGGGRKTGGLMADPKPGGTEKAIADAGLGAVATAVHLTGRHLMHDKFVVRDGRYVWTGSANFTVGGLTLQDNQCLAIDSRAIAKSYGAVFTDLVQAPLAPASAALEAQASLKAVKLTPYFAPAAGEGIDELVVRLLKKAKKVRVMFFVMSDPDILAAVGAFKKRSADIRGVYDPNGMANVTKSKTLPAGSFWFIDDTRFVAAPSKPFSDKRENDFMHMKTMVIDDKTVIPGSHNFSENAEANDENLLVISSRPIACAYTTFFDALFTTYRET
jgi:phosphatidylserine/phosphatidylglycerophosphate/cardiolipin synthase-like enzyme